MPRNYCVYALVFLLAVVSRAQEPKATDKRDEKLRKELLSMMKVDQDARQALIQSGKTTGDLVERVAELDRKNTARMKEIIDKHGWPGRRLVGDDGANAAWLLVQHADQDRAFQKRCLRLLEKAVKDGDATGGQLAYLTDRVRVGENKKQVYGTQFRQVEGKLEPFPIEDVANVDQRRKEIGLSTLAEYKKTLEEAYKPKKKKE
jgi:hypothetical protein